MLEGLLLSVPLLPPSQEDCCLLAHAVQKGGFPLLHSGSFWTRSVVPDLALCRDAPTSPRHECASDLPLGFEWEGQRRCLGCVCNFGSQGAELVQTPRTLGMVRHGHQGIGAPFHPATALRNLLLLIPMALPWCLQTQLQAPVHGQECEHLNKVIFGLPPSHQTSQQQQHRPCPMLPLLGAFTQGCDSKRMCHNRQKTA